MPGYICQHHQQQSSLFIRFQIIEQVALEDLSWAFLVPFHINQKKKKEYIKKINNIHRNIVIGSKSINKHSARP